MMDRQNYDKPKNRHDLIPSLSLDSLIGNVDEKIAHYYLTGGIQLKMYLQNKGQIRCYSASGDKYLEAKFGCTEHTSNTTSLRRCIAASAYYVLSIMLKVNDDVLTEINESNDPKFGDLRIINSFAEAHGFPRNNDLYFMFNAEQQFLVEKYPVKATALGIWKFKHLDIITKRKRHVTFKDEFYTSYVIALLRYYEAQAASRGMTLDKLMDEYKSRLFAFKEPLNYFDELTRKFQRRAGVSTSLLESVVSMI